MGVEIFFLGLNTPKMRLNTSHFFGRVLRPILHTLRPILHTLRPMLVVLRPILRVLRPPKRVWRPILLLAGQAGASFFGGAWPFLFGEVICLVNHVNDRDLSLLNSAQHDSYLLLQTKTLCVFRKVVQGKNGHAMPFYVLWFAMVASFQRSGQTMC